MQGQRWSSNYDKAVTLDFIAAGHTGLARFRTPKQDFLTVGMFRDAL